MTIEVLLSTMHNRNLDVVKKCNIVSDVLIINQCNIEGINDEKSKFGHIRIINTKDRGLSNSRNMALDNAIGDICILCDDDVTYVDNYINIIKEAFETIPKAEVIIFNIHKTDIGIRTKQEEPFRYIKRVPFYKNYGSVHIAFRREIILKKGIRFNPLFGTGSKKYSMGEDSLFFREMHRKGLNIYEYPAIIASVSFKTSSWFSGYNEKYFYDIGAYLSVAYPNVKHILKWYYPLRFYKLSLVSGRKIIKCIDCGIQGYKVELNYEEYINYKKKGIE